MNRLGLLLELVSSLKEEFRGVYLPNSEGVMQAVQVYAQYLPQPGGVSYEDKGHVGLKNYEPDDYEAVFPCVVVKLEEFIDTEEGTLEQSKVDVKILTGIYDAQPESQGYREILNMQERIRQLLLEHRVLGRKYLLRMPLRSRLLEAETWPVWFGEQVMSYVVGRPVQDWNWVHGGKRPEDRLIANKRE